MTYRSPVRDERREPTRELRRAIPNVHEGREQLHDAALAAGDLVVAEPADAHSPVPPTCAVWLTGHQSGTQEAGRP